MPSVLIISSSVYDNTGATYKASKVVSKATGYKLDIEKYKAYSPVCHLATVTSPRSLLTQILQVYMPVTYALNMFGLSFATLSSLLVWVILENRHDIAAGALRVPHVVRSYFSKDKKHTDTNSGHRDVPFLWYLGAAVLALFICIFSVEYWNVELRWYGVLLACAVAMVFYGPVSVFLHHPLIVQGVNISTTQLAIVYATSNLKINIDIFCRIVAGFVFEGKVLANIWFFDIGYITTIKGLYFAEDMKLCDYCKVRLPLPTTHPPISMHTNIIPRSHPAKSSSSNASA